ncbi:MAG: fluoride efflux transporter CrcB [Dehalococcoidia bacterium]
MQQDLTMIAAIALGGALGAVLRYLMALRAYALLGLGLPYGTLTVNLLGAFLIGVVAALVEERGAFGPQARAFITIGILGGMTTFSTFTYETWGLMRDGETAGAVANVLVSVAGALVLFTVGHGLVRLLER